jgi:serine/threonine-protein kinase
MSPELVKGDTLDARSDQYSLGVIAWQALTGALPFRADSPITLLSNIAFEPPELRGVSPQTIKTFERVLSKSPADRFASTSEFAVAFAMPEPTIPHVSVALTQRPHSLSQEKKSLVPWIIAAVVIAAIVIAGAILITKPRATPPQPAAAPQIIPAPPPPIVAAPVVKPKPRVAKKAPAKDTTPEAPKLKPIDPKVVHQ